MKRRFLLITLVAAWMPMPAFARSKMTDYPMPTNGPGTPASDKPLILMMGFDGCGYCHKFLNEVKPGWDKTEQSRHVDFHYVSAWRPSEVPRPEKWREADRGYAWVYQLFINSFDRWTSHDRKDGYAPQDNLSPRFILVYKGQILEAAVTGSGFRNYILPKLREIGFG